MRVYIVRHGKAFDADDRQSDFSRELTARGVSQARFLASKLKSTPPGERRLKTIVASRFPRALQTAHAIQQVLTIDLATDNRLEVDHPVSEAIQIIEERQNERAVMLVGHNPQLGELISVLCAGLPPQELMLKTGELVAIDVRIGQIVGSGKIVERIRMSDDADDSTVGTIDVIAAKQR